MIRIRKILVPIQALFSVFFAVSFLLLVTLFRPSILTGQYVFSVLVTGAAFGIFTYQAWIAQKVWLGLEP
jgi:hypothetical protein